MDVAYLTLALRLQATLAPVPSVSGAQRLQQLRLTRRAARLKHELLLQLTMWHLSWPVFQREGVELSTQLDLMAQTKVERA